MSSDSVSPLDPTRVRQLTAVLVACASTALTVISAALCSCCVALTTATVVGLWLLWTALVLLYGLFPCLRLSGIPGPAPHLFFGHYPELLTEGAPAFYRRMAQRYGKVVRLFNGRTPVLLVTDPDMIKLIGTTYFSTFTNRPDVDEIIVRKSSGLVRAKDEQWKRIRSTVVPIFSEKQLRGFLDTMNKSIETMRANLNGIAGKDVAISMFEWWSGMTMEVIGATAFGTHFPTQDRTQTQKHPLVEASDIIFGFLRPGSNMPIVLLRSFPFLRPLLTTLGKAHIDRLRGALDKLDTLTLSITQKRREDPDRDRYHDFVTLLINARDSESRTQLSDSEVRDQENSFLLAGFETTANTLTFTTFLLSQNPEAEAKLIEEIDRLAPDDKLPTFDELKDFKYAEYCVFEALRIYPVANVIRMAKHDINVAGYDIPAGTEVHCSSFVTHYNPEYFKDPLSFKPERFSEDSEEHKTRHKYAYLPFGMGARMCVGNRFAMEEAKLALVRLYQRFTFRLHEKTVLPLEVAAGITLTPKRGVFMTVLPRKK